VVVFCPNIKSTCQIHKSRSAENCSRAYTGAYTCRNTHIDFFTAQRYASAVYAMAVCPCVTSRCSTKMAKRRIMLAVPHNRLGF